MSINQISTYALNTGLRAHTLRQQRELVDVQKEIATGKHADLGKELGTASSSYISIKTQIQFARQIQDTNTFATTRLSTMQTSMNSMVESANSFIGQITPELNGSGNKELIQNLGQTTLGQFASALNININAEFVFSGINANKSSLIDYQGASGTLARSAVQDAFAVNFGFWVGDPAAENISASDIKAFIDGPFNDLFDDTNWPLLWSGGSDRGLHTKISTQELVETPTTSSAIPFRKITAASVLLGEFANGRLNSGAMDQLVTSAIETMAAGIQGLGNEQAKTGLMEARIDTATQRLEYQSTILTTQMSELSDVDSYEAATRLNQIVVGLEASYAVTARIQSLSLLNYL